jgi:hypothetical protein
MSSVAVATRLVWSAALVLMASIGCLPATALAHPYCRLTTKMPLPGDTCSQQGVGLAWQRACISFSMTQRQRPDPPLDTMRNVADTSFDTWMKVTCDGEPIALQVRETEALGECTTPEYNKRSANANTVIFVSDWSKRDLPMDAFGLTLVWHNPNSGEIYDADMQINETLGSLAVCRGTCLPGRVDLQNVLTHEAGHFLGLGHSSDLTATMAAKAMVGETKKRDLAQDDRDGLCEIYGGLAAADCGASDFEPDRGFSAMCTPPEQTVPASSECSVALGIGTPARPGGTAALIATVLLAWLRLCRRRLRDPARLRLAVVRLLRAQVRWAVGRRSTVGDCVSRRR